MLPFTREQFLGVFVTYNDAIWPLQIRVGAAFLVYSSDQDLIRPRQ